MTTAKETRQELHAKYIANLPPFVEWPKMGRLKREILITEKIDGTNAAIGITKPTPLISGTGVVSEIMPSRIYSQSRTRLISPHDDNFGFARWVEENKDILIETLGPGLHFGEWWGAGVQRGYGLTEKRFSLFDADRWTSDVDVPEQYVGAVRLTRARERGVNIYSTPILYRGTWVVTKEETEEPVYTPDWTLNFLKDHGSFAAPGFMKPEGIVIFHRASGRSFKMTIENDEGHKGQKGN